MFNEEEKLNIFGDVSLDRTRSTDMLSSQFLERFVFLNICGLAAQNFRSTSASICAGAARYHFLGTIFFHDSQLWISSMASPSDSWANVTQQI